MSERKLKTWLEAGLIDSETYQKIADYEAVHSRPLALWAIIGLGALAIILGTISVVAANWEDIPGLVRLGVHAVLIVGLAAWIYVQRQRGSFLGVYMRDVALLVWSVLGLTFFGHLGQVYQTSSPLWQPLLAWMVLFGPVMLLLGRGWLVALLFMTGLIFTSGEYLDWYTAQHSDPSTIMLAVVTSVPVFALVGSMLVRRVSNRTSFWTLIAQIAMVVLVAGISFKLLIEGATSSEFIWSEQSDALVAFYHAAIWIAGAAAITLWSGSSRSRHIGMVVALSALFSLLSTIVDIDSALWGALVFMAYWSIIGMISIHAQWRAVFQIAVAITALRLVVLSFELAADLLASGLGLILAGILTIGVALGAYRFSKAFAPMREASSGKEA